MDGALPYYHLEVRVELQIRLPYRLVGPAEWLRTLKLTSKVSGHHILQFFLIGIHYRYSEYTTLTIRYHTWDPATDCHWNNHQCILIKIWQDLDCSLGIFRVPRGFHIKNLKFVVLVMKFVKLFLKLWPFYSLHDK